MKVKGKIHFVGALKTVSEKFKSKDVVLLTDEKYPQYITIQLTQDKTGLLTENNVGEIVEVSINLRGRKWESPTGEIKYFNTIEGWQINADSEAVKLTPTPQVSAIHLDEDDLPF
jgi:hypothetical protein